MKMMKQKPKCLVCLEQKFNFEVNLNFLESEEGSYSIKEKNCMFIGRKQLITGTTHEFFHLLIDKELTDQLKTTFNSNSEREYRFTKAGKIEEQLVNYATCDYLYGKHSWKEEKLKSIKSRLTNLLTNLNIDVTKVIKESPDTKKMTKELLN